MGPAMLIAHGVPGDALHRRVFELCGRAEPRLCYLGAANHDDARWYSRVAETVTKKYGARCTFARTVGTDESPAAAIAEADLIYVEGGDVSALSDSCFALRAQHSSVDLRRACRPSSVGTADGASIPATAGLPAEGALGAYCGSPHLHAGHRDRETIADGTIVHHVHPPRRLRLDGGRIVELT